VNQSDTVPSMAAGQLRRLRWAVRAALFLGVAASVAANILHAQPNPISQIIAAWPPMALLITVELISRVPVYRRLIASIRIGAAVAIAGIAAWVSYWHMAGVASRYGETGASPYLLPFSVDGLVVIASASLVEISARLRAANTAELTEPDTAGDEPAAPHPGEGANPSSEPAQADRRSLLPGSSAQQVTTTENRSDGPPPQELPEPTRPENSPSPPAPEFTPRDPSLLTAQATDSPDRVGDARESDSVPAGGFDHAGAGAGEAVPVDTAAAVAYWHRRHPELHPAEIGARIGRSERTVRRYLSPRSDNGKKETTLMAAR
jgi:hypothetical protein